MKKITPPAPINFTSSDSEGSDFSYNSSFDEKNEKDQNEIAKNVQLLKDQMNHFFLTNPEFKKNMNFEEFDFQTTGAPPDLKKKITKEKTVIQNFIDQNNPNDNQKAQTPKNNIEDLRNNEQNRKEKSNNYGKYWGQVTDNILKESKKNMGPSVEYINHRLNLFRMDCEKPSVHDILLAESKQTNNFQNPKKSKSLSNVEKMKKEIHEKAEAKLREETGDVQYFSYKKKIQFHFRISKEEKKLEEERLEKEKQNLNKSPNGGKDKLKEPDSPGKRNPEVFERLFLDANRKQNNLQLFEVEEILDKKLTTTPGEDLYRQLKKCPDEDSIKKTALTYLNNFKAKAEENFDLKNSLLNHIPRFYGDESKEFNIFFPDFSLAKGMSQKQIDSIFERPENYDNLDGNVFLLKKMKKIMNGNIIKYWKHLQDSQKN